MEEKQFWIDFVGGKFSVEEMINAIRSNKKYLKWFKGIIPANKKMREPQTKILHDGNTMIVYAEVNFDLEKYIDYMWNFKGRTKTAREYNIFEEVASVIKGAFPYEDIEIDETLRKRFGLLIEVCPDYIGGPEADSVVERVLNNNPNASKKELKNMIKDIFSVTGKNYPKWIQNPEWPISKDGKALKYIKNEFDKKNSTQKYFFENVDTQEIVIVEQCY